MLPQPEGADEEPTLDHPDCEPDVAGVEGVTVAHPAAAGLVAVVVPEVEGGANVVAAGDVVFVDVFAEDPELDPPIEKFKPLLPPLAPALVLLPLVPEDPEPDPPIEKFKPLLPPLAPALVLLPLVPEDPEPNPPIEKFKPLLPPLAPALVLLPLAPEDPELDPPIEKFKPLLAPLSFLFPKLNSPSVNCCVSLFAAGFEKESDSTVPPVALFFDAHFRITGIRTGVGADCLDLL